MAKGKIGTEVMLQRDYCRLQGLRRLYKAVAMGD